MNIRLPMLLSSSFQSLRLARVGVLGLLVGGVMLAARPAIADPIADSSALRDDLLNEASGVTYDPSMSDPGTPIFDAWTTAHPELQIANSITNADVNQISAVADFVVSKRKQTGVLPFTVAEANGGCAGGVAIVVGNDRVPTQFQPVDMWSQPTCNAQGAMAAYEAS